MNAAALFVQPPNLIRTHMAAGGTTTMHNYRIDEYHPKLTAIMANLQHEYGEYKYTVYRCASKVVTLQKRFYTSSIPYKLVLAVLQRHGLHSANASSLMVPPFQLNSLIHDIYLACEKLGHFAKTTSYQLETATAVLVNFFWNIFDANRRHSVSLLEIKVIFLLLCKLCTTEQLLAEFYSLLCDVKTKCVSKYNFQNLLIIFTKTFNYIGEGNAYGSHNMDIVMEQCFARCANAAGLTEMQFQQLWSTTDTRFLIYANLIALIKRIEDTQKLIHNNVCASCHLQRIVGIRFKCQACRDLSLCLKCFATGYATNKHESGHRMYEVFTEDLPPKKFSHYFAKLCNVFCTAKTEETQSFCNQNETENPNQTELIIIEHATNHSVKSSSAPTTQTINAKEAANNSATTAISNVQKDASALTLSIEPALAGLSTTASNALNASERLQGIIDRLLLQNAKLEKQIKGIQSATNEELSKFLSAHQLFLVDIINEMRTFSQNSGGSYPTSSTPHRAVFAKQLTLNDNFDSIGSILTHSINGADINRTYLDANKSDYSLNDLSSWFNQRRATMATLKPLDAVKETVEFPHVSVDMRDTEMKNFKLLLHKVKEIVEDSYSDNTELAEATQNLENVLDSIIQTEESRRVSL